MQFLIGSLFGSKRDLLDLLLKKGMVMVHLDARSHGVDVPEAHSGDHHLRLNLSLNFGIDDFVYDDEGVRASLSFRGQRHYCVLPWHAVFALTSHVEPIGYLWPEDLPSELATRLGAAAPGVAAGTERREASAAAPQPAAPQRPSLRLVRGEDGSDEPARSEENAAEAATAPSAAARRRVARPTSAPPAPQPLVDDAPESSASGEGTFADEGRRYGHLRVVK